MSKYLWSWLVAGSLAVMPVFAQTTPGDYDQSLNVGGQNRTYALHLPPAYTGQKALPLVILLHGRKGSGQIVARYTGMSTKADQAGFIVAYPDATGQPTAWNAGYNSGQGNGDDAGFLRALLDKLQSTLRVDPQRIYFAGHSSGAMMTYQMGAQLGDRLAAIGIVAGSVGGGKPRRGGVTTIPNPIGPVSVVAFHGLQDNTVPYNGGRGFLSVMDSMAFWVRANGCQPQARRQNQSTVQVDTYSGCRASTEVTLFTLQNGTHKWPGATNDPQSGRDLSATDAMWEFFVQHPKRS